MPLYPVPDPRAEDILEAELAEEREAHAETRAALRITQARLEAACAEHAERVRERDAAITAHQGDLMRFAQMMLDFEARGVRADAELGRIWKMFRDYRAGCRCNNKVL